MPLLVRCREAWLLKDIRSAILWGPKKLGNLALNAILDLAFGKEDFLEPIPTTYTEPLHSSRNPRVR
jgi:hypothetical protein